MSSTSFIRRVNDALATRWRSWIFARKHAFLRGIPEGDPKRIVLVVSLTDALMQVKSEAMLAKALQTRGLTPVILTYRACKQAQRYFKAFGYSRFIFLDDLQKEAAAQVDPELCAKILRENTSFRGVLDYVYRDVRVGNHVLSTVVRRLRGGSGTFGDEKVQRLLASLLPHALATVHATELLFDRIRPELCLFLEKGYSPYGEVFDAAVNRNIPCVQFVHSQTADALVMKRYGPANRTTHPFSLAPSTWSKVRAMPWSKEEEQAFMEQLHRAYAEGTWFNRKFLLEGKKMKSPDEVRKQLHLDPAKKTAVIFSHILWDATFFFGTTLFADYEEWLVESVKVACKNVNVNWIVKLHPDYVWKMRQMGETGDPRDVVALQAGIGTLPPHVQIVAPDIDISTYSFFAVTDYAITVRGTVGIEAPCFGIPVLTAGTGRYSGLGFTNDSATREEYLDKLAHIEDIPRLSPEQTGLALRHAYALFELRPMPFTSFRFRRGEKGKRDDVFINVRSAEELCSAPDLQTFSSWVLDGHDEDYLRPRS